MRRPNGPRRPVNGNAAILLRRLPDQLPTRPVWPEHHNPDVMSWQESLAWLESTNLPPKQRHLVFLRILERVPPELRRTLRAPKPKRSTKRYGRTLMEKEEWESILDRQWEQARKSGR
jgi:hypothetical protein